MNNILHCKYQILMTVSLALLLLYPFTVGKASGDILLNTLLNLVFLAALIAVGNNTRVMYFAALLVCPALLLAWLPLIEKITWQEPAEMIFSALFLAYVTWQIFLAVFSQRIISRDTLFGAICIYLLLGLLWSYFYLLLEFAIPGAFTLDPSIAAGSGELSANLLYYSYTTLTTVGYGDITPVSLFARSIAIIEQVTGVFYIAIMMARLVSMYQTAGEQSHENYPS